MVVRERAGRRRLLPQLRRSEDIVRAAADSLSLHDVEFYELIKVGRRRLACDSPLSCCLRARDPSLFAHDIQDLSLTLREKGNKLGL